MNNPTEKVYGFNKEVGGKALLYKGGNLGEMAASEKNLQHRNEYYDDMLKINSYVKYAKLGTHGSFCIEVYRRSEEQHRFDAPYTYLVDIDLCEHHQHIFVENFPLLLQLLKELAPISNIGNKVNE